MEILASGWTSSQEAQTLHPITSERLTLMYRYQRKKHQMNRNASCIAVLSVALISLLFEFYFLLTYFKNAISNN